MAKTIFLQHATLTGEEADALYKMLKEFDEDYEAITIPAWSECHDNSKRQYFLRGVKEPHRFNLTLQRKGREDDDRNFTICFIDAETNTPLGRLDLGKNPKPHLNSDGRRIVGSHFHYFSDGMKDAITFEEFLKISGAKYVKDTSLTDLVGILLEFLCYINVDRKGIPVTEELL